MKRVKDISSFLGAIKVEGDEETSVTTLSPVNDIADGSIVCIDNDKYMDGALKSNAVAIVVRDIPLSYPKDKTFIVVKNPKESFIKLLYFLFEDKKYDFGIIKPTAVIEHSAKVSKSAYIADHVYIGNNASVGDNTVIEAGVFIGDNASVGDNCRIYSNVSIHEGCMVKDRVIIGSSSVIGTDGFGFFEVDGKQMKIPQRGNVVIESDCELGACVMIDRATLGSTVIGEGVKIDNLVQIAHNCNIGAHSIIVSQAGIAGSSTIGHHCILGGQVGLADHVTLGDRVMVGAQSGIMSNGKIESGKILLGTPAQDINREKLCMIAGKKLPELMSAVEERFNIRFKTIK